MKSSSAVKYYNKKIKLIYLNRNIQDYEAAYIEVVGLINLYPDNEKLNQLKDDIIKDLFHSILGPGTKSLALARNLHYLLDVVRSKKEFIKSISTYNPEFMVKHSKIIKKVMLERSEAYIGNLLSNKQYYQAYCQLSDIIAIHGFSYRVWILFWKVKFMLLVFSKFNLGLLYKKNLKTLNANDSHTDKVIVI